LFQEKSCERLEVADYIKITEQKQLSMFYQLTTEDASTFEITLNYIGKN